MFKKLIVFKKTSAMSLALLSVFVLWSCTYSNSTLKSNEKQKLPAGVVLLEEVTAKEGEIVIPFKKYKMDNGLTVILHTDNSDPLVTVDVTYHVGSAREELGKSGFAHFFEHMMFQGSQNVADEQHFKIVTESGGDLNGSTNSDRTNYYQTVPKNQLEKVLWLESDRMGFFIEGVTEEKFEIQRATVKNERQQNVDNRPYGRVNETVSQMIFERKHPYSWPVIGYLSDLDQGTLPDLKQFFVRWYGPNNATLTIGGDIDEMQTLQWVQKYFSDIKAGQAVVNQAKPLVTLENNRYVSMVDNVSLPLIYISYPTVYAFHEDEAALDVLSNILGSGPTSLFYKNLVKSGLTVQASASHPCRELACQMSFIALPNPKQGMELAKIEQVIKQTLTEFEERGVNDDDLLKTKVSIETGNIYGLQSVESKVSSLAAYQTLQGNANLTAEDIARYNRVSKEDVMRVYRKYIKDKGAAILSVIPNSVPEASRAALYAQADNFTLPDVSHINLAVKAQDKPKTTLALANNESHFDRSIIPPSGENPVIVVPDLWQKEFSNGLKIIGTKNSETPTISLLLSLEGGPLLEPLDKAGLASLTANLMEEGTTNYIKEELSNELAKIGSKISFSAAGRNTYIKVSSLTKNIDATLNLMLDMMFNPAFNEADFARLKNQMIQGIKQADKNASSLASKAADQVLYGVDNRSGLPDHGTLKTVASITLDDVKDFYKSYFSPNHASLVIVGDIEESQIIPKLDYLKTWQGPEYTIPEATTFPAFKPDTIFFVNLPDASQTVIKYIRRAMPFDATGDYFKATLMNYPLGGAFNSRINLNLREDKGYTYGASSRFSGGKTLGTYSVGSSVKKEHTADAINEILQELSKMQKAGLTTEEIAFMRSAISQNEALSYETPGQKSGFLRQLLQYNLSKNYGEEQTQIIKTISPDELNSIASKELTLPMQWIVVGDGLVVRSQLESLGLEIIDITLVE